MLLFSSKFTKSLLTVHGTSEERRAKLSSYLLAFQFHNNQDIRLLIHALKQVAFEIYPDIQSKAQINDLLRQVHLIHRRASDHHDNLFYMNFILFTQWWLEGVRDELLQPSACHSHSEYSSPCCC